MICLSGGQIQIPQIYLNFHQFKFVSFFYLLKISEHLWVFLCFQGIQEWKCWLEMVKEVYRNNSNLPIIVSSVNVFNTSSVLFPV